VAGRWVIDATRVTPRTYLEFRVSNGRISGTSEIMYSNHPDFTISGLYAQRKTSIVEARLDASILTFATRRRYTRRLGDSSTMTDLVHRYEGRIDGDRIYFVVQVEGGRLEEVVAERVRGGPPGATLVSTLKGHDGAINQIVLLADGRIASASRDQTARVWNLATGESEFRLPHSSQVQAVVPTAVGTLLGVPDSGPIQEWDLTTGKPRRAFEPLDGRAVAVLPLGDGLLAVSLTTDRIGIWNIATGRVARVVAVGQRMSVAMARAPDGTLACGDNDGGVTLWDVATNKLKRTVRTGKAGYGFAVTGIEALADGRLVYSVSKETNALAWDPGSGREAAINLVKPALWTQVLATLPDGRLALVDSNAAIVLWDPRTGESRAVVDLEREESGLGCVASLPDGRLAVGMGDGPIKVWRLA
jgi:WD40 repeat protein